MASLIEAVNQTGSLATLGTHVAALAFGVAALASREMRTAITDLFGKWALELSFIVALAAMLVSLFYSDVAGYEPCILCWYQRIVMYPQVVLFGVALWKRRRDVADYALALSGIGALIAGYHYLLQWGWVTAEPCAASAVSCSKIFLLTFGYITIPLMSFTAFAVIIILQLIGRRR